MCTYLSLNSPCGGQFNNPDRSAHLQARITASPRALLFAPFPATQLSIAFLPSRACVPDNPICSNNAHRNTIGIVPTYLPRSQALGSLGLFRFTDIAWGFKRFKQALKRLVLVESKDLPGGRAIDFPPLKSFPIFKQGIPISAPNTQHPPPSILG